MFKYLPPGPDERREMLEAIGAGSIDDLFASIPASLRLESVLPLPEAMSEVEIRRFFEDVGRRNTGVDPAFDFTGAGAYHHYVPSTVDTILSRGEFLTSYTPYQPEVAQGTLQSIFEWQTNICILTGLDVANASLYDGATAMVEGIFLARRAFRKPRNKVVLSAGIHPNYRQVFDTYRKNLPFDVVVVPLSESGRTDYAKLAAAVDADTAAVVVQSPTFHGVVEDWAAVHDAAAAKEAKFVAVVAEAISFGALASPGMKGADICVGEAMSLGVPVSFGGPALGFLACRDELKRQMPGRLCGLTTDAEGRRAFSLTLSTREQHIRRERATSNICSNQALMALASNVYICTMGKQGLAEVARQCHSKAEYLKARLRQVSDFTPLHQGPTFNEFAVVSTRSVGEVLGRLAAEGIAGGVPLAGLDPFAPDNTFLVACTELNTREAIDRYIKVLASFV
jgi:glycine dehydrogenase subunit 1